MIQLTKALRREIADLARPKGRRTSHAFMAEGTKCVLDTLGAFSMRYLIATPEWLAAHKLPATIDSDKIIEAGRGVIGEMSSMSQAPDAIAVYDLPDEPQFRPEELAGLTVALDRVQDPGNLGTIMRTADWMGIDTILASDDTVDCFNPKTVQATMGAISRVKVIYGDLPAMLERLAARMPVCGTFLGGENVYTADLPECAVVVMGNEGSGISDEVSRTVNRRLLIPSWPPERPTSESLNVATATAIVLSQFRSRLFKK
ncbi:MAG: RNA methyltransferase [Muribaculaceae bacterium]|nr:RNA methyltransferase [Muribaculaceae bacterium]